jgi:hypothetical protein
MSVGTFHRKLSVIVADDVAAVCLLDVRSSRRQEMPHARQLQGVLALAADVERRIADRRSGVIILPE